MPRIKSTNPLPDYKRVSPQNKELLSQLTRRAIGNRTLAEFASLCEVHPSSISRLINQKQSKPNSDELIIAIANNAEQGSGVSLEELLEAHGLKYVSQLPEKPPHFKHPEASQLEKTLRDRITRLEKDLEQAKRKVSESTSQKLIQNAIEVEKIQFALNQLYICLGSSLN